MGEGSREEIEKEKEMIQCEAALMAENCSCGRAVTTMVGIDELGKTVYLCASHAVMTEAGGVIQIVGLGGIVTVSQC